MRECGGCTLCCKLVEVTELHKLRGQQCPHCNVGSGCRIYDTRPEGCRIFECLWLKGLVPEELKPDEVRVVLDYGEQCVIAHCEPHRETLKDARVQRFLEACQQRGIDVLVVQGGVQMLQRGKR